jgi:hypothetical protein
MTGWHPAGLVGRRGFPCPIAIGATPSSFSDLVIVINDQFPKRQTAAFSGLASSSESPIAHMGSDRGNAAELGHLKGEAAIW